MSPYALQPNGVTAITTTFSTLMFSEPCIDHFCWRHPPSVGHCSSCTSCAVPIVIDTRGRALAQKRQLPVPYFPATHSTASYLTAPYLTAAYNACLLCWQLSYTRSDWAPHRDTPCAPTESRQAPLPCDPHCTPYPMSLLHHCVTALPARHLLCGRCSLALAASR